ncbi:cation:proton antiporter [Lewinella sp. JB7]|uniref:cation:proton antiporter n=1 Tax=Lewinella sp. JB7 TaxID=2962887 RepID=UPI0020C94B67|nr:cation:proton antiporter [Lewinella sp. JB7]MCP9235745.1 cation:proton antiporter [Lewinella sp. JB7]
MPPLLLLEIDVSLPLTDPVVKFLLILVIILFTPLILNKFRIPHLLGLIIAGAVVGPYGLHLMERDSGIILSGTAGLLYIMFLAGLEIDLAEFRKNSRKSAVFGLYTFLIPLTLGIVTGLYVLGYPTLTSILLASMFASHTLIAYPMVSRMGVAKNRAVNITVGGTVITDVLALLVLAVIVGMTRGEVNAAFWLRLGVSVPAFGAFVLLGFPVVGRWFFKRFDDSVSQYVFVLAMVFLGAVLAQLAGVEGIIGAFLAGLALNRLIPLTSPLMNRIEFVGNAIFIPFFLIGVGMLIDFRAFITDLDTIRVAVVMTVVATVAKFTAAWLTQRTFGFSVDERRLIFGLSNAQAAATLAAVLVGYNTIVGTTPTGLPLRLLDENVLNGTILMILVTCTTASLVAQRGARNVARREEAEAPSAELPRRERILIPVSNQDTTDELINLGVTVRGDRRGSQLYALSVVDHDTEDASGEMRARKLLQRAAVTAAATDNVLLELLRYDLSVVNGITSVVKEHRITDLIMGVHVSKGITDTFLGHLTEGILTRCNITTLLYKPVQPFATLRRHRIVLPHHAEMEPGFPAWLAKVWNIGKNSGARMVFHGPPEALEACRERQRTAPIDAVFSEFNDWDDFLILAREFQPNDNLILIMSRPGQPSFQRGMRKIPAHLNRYFQPYSFIIIYPMQEGVEDSPAVAFRDPSLTAPLRQINQLGESIAELLKR